ncbi:hypothetical protein SDC9_158909 [bioreactor metagenome]|uniref:Uncharacterized protein n=1 Tax=bioreactor metagenome TaxID=1076179 RepID=A0A645FDF2_9ZZZZ
MGQKVGDGKHGIVGGISHRYVDGRTVLFINHPLQREGQSRPLIFFDAAVIMGLKKGEIVLFIQGIGL